MGCPLKISQELIYMSKTEPVYCENLTKPEIRFEEVCGNSLIHLQVIQQIY